LATASYSQSYDPAMASPTAHEEQVSIGAQFKFGAASFGLNHLTDPGVSDRWPEQTNNHDAENNASFTLDLLSLSGSSLLPLKLNLSARKTDSFGQT